MSVRTGDLIVADAELRSFAGQVLERVGFSRAEAAELARGLVEADLRGLPSHGVMHLPNLVKRTRLGLVRAGAASRTLADSPSIARIDAMQGAGILVAARAMDLAIEKAAATGVGAVAVSNSTHFGMGGIHAERAARSGMIGIALANTTPAMPAPDGMQSVIGTNPIAIAVPGEDGEPAFMLDMGLSQVTLGFVRNALQRGAQLPAGVAAAADGTPTSDPAKALEGFLLPAGAHKGFGLAVAIEVLAGVLAGSGIGPEVGSLFVDYDRPQRTGHFLLALDVRHFIPGDEWRERLGFLVAWIKGSARAEGAGPALLPGERERLTARERRASGVPLDDETADGLRALAGELDVPPPTSLRR